MQGLLLAGRYRLVDTIGSGGMGRVWRARDEVLHRAVAVKELTAALYVTEGEQARLFARTDAEARAAARINHSAVVTVHDVLDHDNRPWIVMELVEGTSLADAVKERGLVEPREAARIGLWVLRALRAAHEAGVLHRDVKPGNVLLAEDGRVLLTDFGIAQVEGDTTITRTGEIVGSVDYIAPERVRGHDPGPAADLWALGATLYTAVEGKSPFRRTTPLTTMQAVVDEEPAEPEHAGPLGPVIMALLRKDPAGRPGAVEAEQMLAEAAEGRWPSSAQAYVPTQHVVTGHSSSGAYGSSGTYGSPGAYDSSGADGSSVRDASGTYAVTHHQPPGRRRRRGRGRTVVLVVVLAALVGGGGAVAMRYADGGTTGPGTGTDVRASATPTAESTPTDAAVPKEWVRVPDPQGFSLALPERSWKRKVVDKQPANGLMQIDYTPDKGEHFVRIAVDKSPDFDSPYRHQLDLEQQLKRRLREYRLVSMKEHMYRDRPGALWDFTWTALTTDPGAPGPRRAIELTYLARDGVEYAIYMSGPVEDWDTTREQFDTVLRGWRPPGE